MLKGYMLISRNTERVHGQRKVGNPWSILTRPVTRRGKALPRKFFAPPGKMCWIYFEIIGHSSKNLGPSPKTLRPSWCPKLVTGLISTVVKRHLMA